MKCSDFPAGLIKVEAAQGSQVIVLPCELEPRLKLGNG